MKRVSVYQDEAYLRWLEIYYPAALPHDDSLLPSGAEVCPPDEDLTNSSVVAHFPSVSNATTDISPCTSASAIRTTDTSVPSCSTVSETSILLGSPTEVSVVSKFLSLPASTPARPNTAKPKGRLLTSAEVLGALEEKERKKQQKIEEKERKKKEREAKKEAKIAEQK